MVEIGTSEPRMHLQPFTRRENIIHLPEEQLELTIMSGHFYTPKKF